MEDSYSVKVKNLTKKFGNFTAVDHIDFEVKKGEIFGFLGANGAGKTTTIRMLCGLLKPSGGSGIVAGYDINNETENIKKKIGYMSQKFSLYNDLTVEENIEFFGGMYGLPAKEVKQKKEWIIDLANLQGMRKRITQDLAGGWKQRLALGTALIHDPDIVFLDEPTAGVDPVSRRDFWEIINNFSDQGITIFVTTHYLDEAEYCNTIKLMDKGKIIAGGSPEDLKTENIEANMYQIETDNLNKAKNILASMDEIINVAILGINLNIMTNQGMEKIENIIKKNFNKNDIKLLGIKTIEPTLEDVFVHLID
ncbi:MAG: ATP-binding cassette domain-containing protein [Candidatus Mcinerneyibacterium aminivorans]|uniref:ATP-binding cassette domain-containing protein n=1 Tax=Candidatus Mcinerneyibacterium aminivorans TaxID=2703815 RepID=A0A5D0MJ84_9BACT|nr:MAG: ATP-binding cassette domain-containing protein [Candidatus Mcinerneyibacterium aminivorans]